jgi:hypothetical protein
MAYDVDEARELLTRFADEVQPDVNAREAAARALLKALLGLNDHARTAWLVGNDSIQVVKPHVGRATVTVDAGTDYTVLVLPERGDPVSVAVQFNPVTRQFESTKDDPRPRPAGEAPRRRSAVAEVVETVLTTLRAQRRT